MSSYRIQDRIKSPVFNQVVNGVFPVTSEALDLTSMGSVCFQFVFASGLNATFQLLGSLDGVNYSDLLTVVSPAVGVAGSSIANQDVGAVKWVMAQITPSSGSGQVTVLAFAKSRP